MHWKNDIDYMSIREEGREPVRIEVHVVESTQRPNDCIKKSRERRITATSNSNSNARKKHENDKNFQTEIEKKQFYG